MWLKCTIYGVVGHSSIYSTFFFFVRVGPLLTITASLSSSIISQIQLASFLPSSFWQLTLSILYSVTDQCRIVGKPGKDAGNCNVSVDHFQYYKESNNTSDTFMRTQNTVM